MHFIYVAVASQHKASETVPRNPQNKYSNSHELLSSLHVASAGARNVVICLAKGRKRNYDPRKDCSFPSVNLSQIPLVLHCSGLMPTCAHPPSLIPVSRSLTDMILNNHDLISFVPGERCNGTIKTPGRIIVHDRNRIQSQVLPIYFNHASFASLRRQLSYFSFVRLGKERQSGTVTYVNDAVVELSDILHLKRRTAGDSSPGSAVSDVKAQAMDVKEASQEQYQQRTEQWRASREEQQPRPDRTHERSGDVASAVLSGRMHACETNHDLDAKKYQQALSVSTSKSTSAITLGTKSRADTTSNKLSSNKKRYTFKYKRGRKAGHRIDRLLYINNIVPFIHLPVRLFEAKSLQEDMVKGVRRQPNTTSVESRKARLNRKVSVNRSVSNSTDNEEMGYEVRGSDEARTSDNSSGSEEKWKGGTTSASSLTESNFHSARPENDRHASETVISALLALGKRR